MVALFGAPWHSLTGECLAFTLCRNGFTLNAPSFVLVSLRLHLHRHASNGLIGRAVSVMGVH